jgi:Tfp pilus assembly protein PilO
MENQAMNWVAVQRQLSHRFAQLGLVGSVGVILLLAALLTWFTLVQGDQQELIRLNQGLSTLRQQEAAKNSLLSNPILSQEEQLALFYKNFPDELQVPDLLKEIFKAAENEGLTLETAEYTVVKSGTDRLIRYRVSLPVKGAFKQMLQFMDTVLKQSAAVALENAAFKRDKVDDGLVEGKLVFVVLVDSRP